MSEMTSQSPAWSAAPCYLCGRSTHHVVANAGYSFQSCVSCGFRMQHPLPDPADDEGIYGDEFYADRSLDRGLDAQDAVNRSLIDQRVHQLTEVNGGPGALLDVGAGTGLFVEACVRAGWQATGIDPSAAAVRIAEKVTSAKVLHGRLEDVVVEPKYDAVTLWDVLEHLSDPRAGLRRIAGLLAPHGVVAISLPNVSGLKSRLLGKRWRYYRRDFGHVSHFSPSTLTMLLGQAGFAPVAVRTSGLFNLGKAFGLNPAEVRADHRLLSRMQAAADAAAGGMGLGEDLVVVGRRSSP